MSDVDLDRLRAAILAAYPELSASRFRLLPEGWHSTAVDVDDRVVFKFPRGVVAEQALAREARLLAVVRTAVTMAVPDMVLHPGPPMFSRHGKIPGEQLLEEHYARLPEAARADLAGRLARFFAELHGLDRGAMARAGAMPVAAWQPPEAILERAVPALPRDLRRRAEDTVRDWQDMAPDPYGTTYGFFDGHGWNMAFDHARQRLNGIYDFADSGFGPLHQEFVYPGFVSPDLVERITGCYEGLTGRSLDRPRIRTLTGVLHLSELAEAAGDPALERTMVHYLARWASWPAAR